MVKFILGLVFHCQLLSVYKLTRRRFPLKWCISLILWFFMSKLPSDLSVEAISHNMAVQLSLSNYGNLTITYPKPSESKELQEISSGFVARLCCSYSYGIGYIRKHLSAQSRFFRECVISPAVYSPNHFLIKPRNLTVMNEINQGRPWLVRGLLVVMQEVDFPFEGEEPELMFEPMWCSFSGLPTALQNKHDLDIIFSCMGYIIQIQPKNFSMVPNSLIRIQFMYDVRTPLLATLNSIFTDCGRPVNFSYLRFPKAICHYCRIVEHSAVPCIKPNSKQSTTPMEVAPSSPIPSNQWALAMVQANSPNYADTIPQANPSLKGKRKESEMLMEVKIEEEESRLLGVKKFKDRFKGSSSNQEDSRRGRHSGYSSDSLDHSLSFPSKWLNSSQESLDSQEERRRHLFADSLLVSPGLSLEAREESTNDQPS